MSVTDHWTPAEFQKEGNKEYTVPFVSGGIGSLSLVLRLPNEGIESQRNTVFVTLPSNQI